MIVLLLSYYINVIVLLLLSIIYDYSVIIQIK